MSSVVAGLGILGHWTDDEAVLTSIRALPETFAQALQLDWSPVLSALQNRNSLYVLGRGPALAIAEEAALKF